MGSKRKFWYRHPGDNEPWLFKYPQQNTGQHWAEKIVAELAALLRIPHARVELALHIEERGSVTRSFVSDGLELVHGNQLLAVAIHGYDTDKRFGQSSHTLTNIWRVMDYIFREEEDARRAKRRTAAYLVLDALVGNTDRHHENWGVLWAEDTIDLAPSFDHASSLGRELQDDRRNWLITQDRVGEYIKNGRGAIYWSEGQRHGPGPLELVRLALGVYPELFRPALHELEQLDEDAVRVLVERIPSDWMSTSARSFAIALMSYSYAQLREMS